MSARDKNCVGCHQTQCNPHGRIICPAGFSTACETRHKPTDAQWTGVTSDAVFAPRRHACDAAMCDVSGEQRLCRDAA